MNFGTGRKFGTDVAKRYGEGSEMLVFLGKRGRETVQKVKNYGGSKILRIRECRTIFSTEGSFGSGQLQNEIGTRSEGDTKLHNIFQGPLNGGVSNGGVSRSGLVLPFLSFFVLLGLSRGFSRFVRGLSGDFPRLVLFLFLRPIKSTYEEQSRKGPRHNLDHSRKKWETPGFGNTPV